MAVARALTALITTLVLVLPGALTKAAWVPLVGGDDGIGEEGGTHQVGVGVDIGGVVPVKLHQLVGDALDALLLPLQLGVFLLEGLNFLLVALYHAGNQLFGIQPAGKAEMML